MAFPSLQKLAIAALLVAAALEGAAAKIARRSDGRIHANMPPRPSVPIVEIETAAAPVTSRNGTTLPPYSTTYYFDQLIDHNNPSLGTFQQRYWHTYEFYETGGPIVLFTPGEANAAPYTGYLTNRTVNGQIAQAQSGAAIVLEHRFYGLSNPYPDLSVKSLQVHTIQQAIDDLEYFAKNAVLPQPDGANVKPGQAPWVLIGGSYSGALTSFAMTNKPGLFQAGYASSAVVESIVDFYGYFTPIREGMAKNCSADVQAVIAHIDSVFSSKNQKSINSLLAMFNMTPLASHLDDAAGALRNNLWDWQSLSPTAGYGTFFQFCDALEVKNGKSASAKGWGLNNALQAWSSFWVNEYYPNLCGDLDIVSCLGSYDPTQEYWTNTSIDNAGRSWFWIVCNEVGFFQEGAPKGTPTLVSRLVQPPYDERQCTYMFPDQFKDLGHLPVPDVDATNKAYDGWFTTTQNLFFANGHRDPWRDATKSAEGTHFESTPGQPIAISDGFHCSDLSTANGAADATVIGVQKAGLASIAGWLAEWKPS
ncbi:peptidase S28 [Epithele typhae]|uniref:peptidase S28 n=1 Tax=Epithele typhae TaxID=378194 RepID=UPI00200879E7|nr:peptidase S28 [Epithele typhae]KAH9943173.1 peptidase S28 [Epithele typhae]